MNAVNRGANYPPANQMTVEEMIEEMDDVLGLHDPREVEVVIDGQWCKQHAFGDPCAILDVDTSQGSIRLRNINSGATFSITVEEAYKARRQNKDFFWRADNGCKDPVDEVREFAVFLEKPQGKEFIDLVEVDMTNRSWKEVRQQAVKRVFGSTPYISEDAHVVDFSGSEPAPVDEIV